MKHFFTAAVLAIGMAFASLPAMAGNQLAVALSGYDTVSYHQGDPQRGEARINHFWNGAIWFFTSTENRDMFAADPEAFAPAFDGYCSWAASQGYTAPGDPTVWEITDGVLYVQVHPRAQELWQEDTPTYIIQANENWPLLHPF